MTRRHHAARIRILALLASGIVAGCAGTGSRLLDRAGRAGEREAGERIDRGVSGAANAAEDAVLRGDDAATRAPDGSTRTSDGATPTRPAGVAGPAQQIGVAADFERGERPVGHWDFAADVVGDFPRRLELGEGSWDVVEYGGGRLLRSTGSRWSDFQVPLPETLPERFTLEFDVLFSTPSQQIVVATSPIQGRSVQRYPAALIRVVRNATGLEIPSQGRQFTAAMEGDGRVIDRPTTIRMMVDGSHVKVYAGAARVANVPNAPLERSDRLHFMDAYGASAENPIFIGSIRVDAGGRDLYAAIERDGRVAVRDILFDTDSERIRPESREALDAIGAMLREHADLRLSIEGHTDSQGADAHNLDLSERRAAAVRRWLIEEYAIDAARLRAEGRGENAPVATNDTPEGRQQNRRVELVRSR